MVFEAIAETESYVIAVNKYSPFNSILIRKIDNNYCYLSDYDSNRLCDTIDNSNEFTILCNSFVFTDPLLERASYVNS